MFPDIKEVRRFIDWALEGDNSLQQRCDLFLERKRMTALQQTSDLINHKCSCCKAAGEPGTESIIYPSRTKANRCVWKKRKCPVSGGILKRVENSVFRSHNLCARCRLGIDVSRNSKHDWYSTPYFFYGAREFSDRLLVDCLPIIFGSTPLQHQKDIEPTGHRYELFAMKWGTS